MGKRLSAEEWVEIEYRYRNGEPAKTLAVTFGISPSTVHQRASREGWRAQGPRLPVSLLDRLERVALRLEHALYVAKHGGK